MRGATGDGDVMVIADCEAETRRVQATLPPPLGLHNSVERQQLQQQAILHWALHPNTNEALKVILLKINLRFSYFSTTAYNQIC